MPVEIRRVAPSVEYSVYRWLQTTTYKVGNLTTTLTGHFTQPKQLKILPDYPDDLEQMKAPTLAVMITDQRPQADFRFQSNEPAAHLYGADALVPSEDLMSLMIYGFVVGCGTDAVSRLYRDKLMNDVYYLLKYAAADTGITLWDTDGNELGSVDVQGTMRRRLPGNVFEVEADRYKFLVEAAISYSHVSAEDA
jgi:hypothetical protein